MKETLTVVGGVLLVVVLMLGYNLYTHSKNTESYKACLEVAKLDTSTFCYPPR